VVRSSYCSRLTWSCCCCWASLLSCNCCQRWDWRGRVLSCNSNLRVPCIGFESILRVYDSLVKFSQSSVVLFYLHRTVAPVLIDAQGTKLIAVLCRLVLSTYRMVAPVLIDAQGTKPRISSRPKPWHPSHPASEHVSTC
jgi:hypothetical protein